MFFTQNLFIYLIFISTYVSKASKHSVVIVKLGSWSISNLNLITQKRTIETVFRQGRTLLDQGCPNFDENFFGASVHEKIEI